MQGIEKNENHVECSISDLDLFTPSFVQDDVEGGLFEDIYPITKLEDNGPIEFVIENSSDKFLDLANSYLKLKCKVTKGDGTNLAETDKVTTINYPIATLFSQVDVILGGKVISSSTNTYPYRAYLETLLNYGEEAKNTQLGMGLFYKDTAGALGETDPERDNVGLKTRFAFCSQSKTIHLLGRVHTDLCYSGRLLINGVPLKLTLHRQKNAFVLISGNENPDYKVKLLDVLFCIRKVQLTPHKFQEIQQRMEKRPAVYPINRVDIKSHSVAAGLSSLNWDNAIIGQLPNRIFIGMVDNTGFTGLYGNNPFYFKNYYVSSIATYLNGKSLPSNPISLNFENGDYLDGYRSLFMATGKINRDEGIGITRGEYKDGYTLFGFDLSPALCQGAHQEYRKNGNLRIAIEFMKPLENSITVLIYCEFDNSISIYKSRQVLKDY